MTDTSQRGEVVVVPREPTMEMFGAGVSALEGGPDAVWSAMLAAASPAPSGDSGGELRDMADVCARLENAARHGSEIWTTGIMEATGYVVSISDFHRIRQALALRDAGGGS